MIKTKRIYDNPSPDDGERILVERLWPRGKKKEDLKMQAWIKEVAPSPDLRKWFNHDPKKWQEFRDRYFKELDQNPQAWKPILDDSLKSNVTLLYSSHDTDHNNAKALEEYLNQKRR